MRKLLVKWKENIKEQGLEALRNVYLREYKLEDDKFNTRDFKLDMDCDSTTDGEEDEDDEDDDED
jgi:hypothetical protein